MQFLVIGSGHLNNITNKRHNWPDHPFYIRSPPPSSFLGHVFLSRAVLISRSFFSCSFLFSSRYFEFSLSKFFSLMLLPLIFVFSCLSTRISLSWTPCFCFPSSFLHCHRHPIFLSPLFQHQLPLQKNPNLSSACLSSLGWSPHTQPENNLWFIDISKVNVHKYYWSI